jgi:hypothetical protein
MESDLVLVGFAGFAGSTIRWVERVAAGVARVGRIGAPPGRGMTIGCVVAAPAGMPAEGIKPESWGGFGGGGVAEPGGV